MIFWGGVSLTNYIYLIPKPKIFLFSRTTLQNKLIQNWANLRILQVAEQRDWEIKADKLPLTRCIASMTLHLFLHKFEIMLSHVLVVRTENDSYVQHLAHCLARRRRTIIGNFSIFVIRKKSTEAVVSVASVSHLLFWIIVLLCSKEAPTETPEWGPVSFHKGCQESSQHKYTQGEHNIRYKWHLAKKKEIYHQSTYSTKYNNFQLFAFTPS